MPFVQAKCPNCGGFLAVDADHDAAVCQFCDTPFIVEKAIINYNITNNVNIGAGAIVNVNSGIKKDFIIVGGVLKKYTGEATNVVIPNDVTVIFSGAFEKMGIHSVTIPEGVKVIGERAFSECLELSNVILPDSISAIGMDAFRRTRITSVNIPSSLTIINERVFFGCDRLETITIPDSVKEIGAEAFSESGLISLAIPGSVSKIGKKAFKLCNQLKSITIKDSGNHISIDDNAFDSCGKLSRVIIPDRVTNIGSGAFWNCGELTEVIINEDLFNKHIFSFMGTKYHEQVIDDRKKRNVCLNCGGELKGLFSKKCSRCGKSL